VATGGGEGGEKRIVEKIRKQPMRKEDIQLERKEKGVNMVDIWSQIGLF